MMTGFIRLHKPPRYCRQFRYVDFQLRPVKDWPAKARWLFNRSYERYIADPVRAQFVEEMKNVLYKGEVGFIDRFRIITT